MTAVPFTPGVILAWNVASRLPDAESPVLLQPVTFATAGLLLDHIISDISFSKKSPDTSALSEAFSFPFSLMVSSDVPDASASSVNSIRESSLSGSGDGSFPPEERGSSIFTGLNCPPPQTYSSPSTVIAALVSSPWNTALAP